jgi:hypothetical protein
MDPILILMIVVGFFAVVMMIILILGLKKRKKHSRIMSKRSELGEEMANEEKSELENGELTSGFMNALPIGMDFNASTEPLKFFLRKTTIFYKKRMNPMKISKLSVVLSSEDIYDNLKDINIKAERAASKKLLKIDQESPFIKILPKIPNCICIPSIMTLDASKRFDIANFLITPLSTGRFSGTIKIIHNDVEIDEIKVPIKIVTQLSTKISTTFTVMIPVISSLFDTQFSDLLSAWIPFYATLGGFEGFIAILTGISAIFSGISYLIKRPKDAEPITSDIFSLEDYIATNMFELLKR